MKRKTTALVVAICTALGISGNALADSKKNVDPGKGEYISRCAACHGADGKGGGEMKDVLKVAPADLTVLAMKNGGVFPFDRVYAVIDGREVVKGHGSRDMPVWGKVFIEKMTEKSEYYFGGPEENEMEVYARTRILALIDYLNRIQARK